MSFGSTSVLCYYRADTTALYGGFAPANTGYVTQGPEESAGYGNLILKFKQSLNPLGKTVSLGSAVNDLNGRFFPVSAHGNLDWWSVQTYGFHGPEWTGQGHTGHASQIHPPSGDNAKHWPYGLPDFRTPSFDTALAYWLDRGIPRSKLQLGVGLYGNWFTRGGVLYTDFSVPPVAGTTAPYRSLKSTIDLGGWTRHDDGGAIATYYYQDSGDDIITLPSEEFVQAAMRFTVAEGLPGVMAWAAGQDWMSGQSRLIHAMKTTPDVLRRLWLGATAFTKASGTPTRGAFGNGTPVRRVAAWSMPHDSASSITTSLVLPADWNSTVPIVAMLHWTRAGSALGVANFDLGVTTVAVGDQVDEGSTIESPGNTWGPIDVESSPPLAETLGVTPLGAFSPTANRTIRLALRRNVVSGGTPLTAAAWILGIELQYAGYA